MIPDKVLASPEKVVNAFNKLNKDSYVLKSIIFSFERLILGFSIALVLGILIGFLITKNDFLRDNVRSLVLSLQTLPNIAWVPVSILWFGYTNMSILFTIVIGSVFAMILATEEGISNINPLYLKAAKTMGAKGKKLYMNVIFPGALPTIVIGMKQAWSFAWRALISGEMLANRRGLGYILTSGKKHEDINEITLVLLLIILIGVIFERNIFERFASNLRQKWGLEK